MIVFKLSLILFQIARLHVSRFIKRINKYTLEDQSSVGYIDIFLMNSQKYHIIINIWVFLLFTTTKLFSFNILYMVL